MNYFLNYLIEANIGLCVFAAMYFVLLRNETDFRIKRFVLLGSIFASLVFPAIHISGGNGVIPTLSDVVPTVWLPEVTVNGVGSKIETTQSLLSPWTVIAILYSAGVILFTGLFIFQIWRLVSVITSVPSRREDGLRIAESPDERPSFSFFNFIFIGNVTVLSEQERAQILSHETVHVQQHHSFDILILNVLGIFFWFNPILRVYHKIFIQLHEFEADARSVKSHEVNEYCSLLARVALMSADISMANYFNNSLTVKRIEMMRKIKLKLKRWKFAALGATVVGFFFLAACQDQVMSEISEIAKSSSMATDVPSEVKKRYDQLQAENPGHKFLLLELNDHAVEKLGEVEKQYGLPTSMEVFKFDENGKLDDDVIKGTSESGIIIEKRHPRPAAEEKTRSFAILQYTGETKLVTELSKTDDVFTVVEESATPVGGMPVLFEHIGQNMKYPGEAASKGIQGTVFIEFIVETNGEITSERVMKGIDPMLDAEALRVSQGFPAWNPGKQNGVAVRQKMVLPIKFNLGS